MPSIRAHYWFLTIKLTLGWIPEIDHRIVYIKAQQELGDKTGYKHWQAVIHTAEEENITDVRKLLPKGTWIQKAKAKGALNYCHDERKRIPGTEPIELGTPVILRERKCAERTPRDWAGAILLARSGRIYEIPAAMCVQYYNTWNSMYADSCEPMERNVTVIAFWGRTGTGKSLLAKSEANMEPGGVYWKDNSSKWWDGYKGEASVVIDDFAGGVSVGVLQRWLDRYPLRVEIKGKFVAAKFTKVWITSNVDPRDWYPETDAEIRRSILRRISREVYFEYGNKHYLDIEINI